MSTGYFPLPDLVKLDPDRFKPYFPEWETYIATDQWSAGFNTRKESGMMVEIGQDAAMCASKNIWVDGSLRDGVWFASVFNRIRQEFPQYRIAILHVFASTATIKKRVLSRGKKTGKRSPCGQQIFQKTITITPGSLAHLTLKNKILSMSGRFVPEVEILDSIERVPRSVELLTPECDFVAHIENEHTPRLTMQCNSVEGCQVNTLNDWTEVRERFTTLPVLKKRRCMKKLAQAVKELSVSSKVVVFSKSFCIFCTKLKTRLSGMGISFSEILLDKEEDRERGVAMQLELSRFTNIHTVPQLFVSGVFVRHDKISDADLTAKHQAC
jgi:glutaredoxin